MKKFDTEAWTLDRLQLQDIHAYTEDKIWEFPNRTVHFLCDLHADADALKLSLEASGAALSTNIGHSDFRLTEEGKKALFVIGGDCLDKGPSNFKLLEALRELDKQGEVVFLAGNHDLRTFIGLKVRKDGGFVETEHLFTRMGKRAVPLLSEVSQTYDCSIFNVDSWTDAQIEDKLFPSDNWYREFPLAVAGYVSKKRIEKEIKRIPKKIEEFKQTCQDYGLTLQQVYAALLQARRMLDAKPDDNILSWFFSKLELVHREGSFLFLHAGVDDYIAFILKEHGIGELNQRFVDRLKGDDKTLFSMYHASLGNVMRTKYRDVDFPLNQTGIDLLHEAGINAIVHGHRNGFIGQRLVLRDQMLNVECDCSVDCNTRRAAGLEGNGYAVTTFMPDGTVLGRSADHNRIKVFQP